MRYRGIGFGLAALMALLAGLLLSTCHGSPTPYFPATITSTLPVRTPSPPPSQTIAVTPFPSATTRPPSTAPRVFNLIPVGEIGGGRHGFVTHSPYGHWTVIVEGETLHWLDAATQTEKGSVTIEAIDVPGFSPDGRWILVSKPLGAGLLDTTTGRIQYCCSDGFGSGTGFTFSKDSHYLAYRVTSQTTGGPYGAIYVYDLQTAQNYLPTSGTEWGESYPVLNPENYHLMSDPALSHDGQWVAAGLRDSSHNLLYIWDMLSGEIRHAIPHPAEIYDVAISPDGRYLATACLDGLVRIFNPATGALEHTLSGFKDSIPSWVNFAENGGRLEIGANNQADQVYDLLTGKFEKLTIPENTPDPYVLSWHQQGLADGDQVLFSPDHQHLAIGGESVQIWDIASKELRGSLENPYGNLYGWVFSPDGKQLAGITREDTIIVWDVANSALVMTLTGEALAAGLDNDAVGGRVGAGAYLWEGLAFSPDGATLAFGNGYSIELWDVQTGEMLKRLVQPDEPVYTTRVSFSVDGKQLFAILDGGRATQIWDMQTGQLLQQHDYHAGGGSGRGVVLNADLFARSNVDDTGSWIELWDLDTNVMQKLITDSTPALFSPDGKLLVSRNTDHLYFWATDSGSALARLPLSDYQSYLAISPDNTTLAIGKDGRAQLWDISSLQDALVAGAILPATPTPVITPTAANPKTPPIPTRSVPLPTLSAPNPGALSAENANQMREIAHFGNGILSEIIWSTNPQILTSTIYAAGSQGIITYQSVPLTQTAHLSLDAWIEAIVQREDGDLLAAGVTNKSVQVWNISPGVLLAEFSGTGPLHFNPQGSQLVYRDDDGNLRVYDLLAEKQISTLFLPYGYEPQVPRFSPDGALVAAVVGYSTRLGTQNFVRIWDSSSGAIVSALGSPDASITDLVFSENGSYLAGAAGGSAWVWDIQPGSMPTIIELYPVENKGNLTLYHQRVTAVAFSPDSRFLAVGDSERNIWLFDWRTRVLIRRFAGLSSAVNRLRYSRDGAQLLSVDQDGNLIQWKVATGRQVTSLATHTGLVRGVAAGEQGSLRAWQANTAWELHPADGALLHTTSVYSGTILAASPEGNWLAVSNRLYITVWDGQTGKFWQRLEGEAGDPFVEHYFEGLILPGFYAAEFAPGTQQLIVRSPGEIWTYALEADRRFVLLDYVPTGYLDTIETAEHSVASQDGQLLVTIDQIWRSIPQLILSDASGEQLRLLKLPESKWVSALAISPDSRLVAVGSVDGTITLVDVARWEILVTLTGHERRINALAFTFGGLYLASASDDGTVRIWGTGADVNAGK